MSSVSESTTTLIVEYDQNLPSLTDTLMEYRPASNPCGALNSPDLSSILNNSLLFIK